MYLLICVLRALLRMPACLRRIGLPGGIMGGGGGAADPTPGGGGGGGGPAPPGGGGAGGGTAAGGKAAICVGMRKSVWGEVHVWEHEDEHAHALISLVHVV